MKNEKMMVAVDEQ
jgi:hypothetical protein